jgi:hypothetical protein
MTASVLRVQHWPLAAKIIGLCVTTATVLAIVLTSMAYLQASHALQRQADAALASDGQLVANSIDAWHEQHLKAVLALAKLSVVHDALTSEAPDEDPSVPAADQALTAVSQAYPDSTSFGLLGLDGLFALSSDPAEFKVTTAKSRDYFVEGLKQETFVSGVQGGTVATDPGLVFHSASIHNADGKVVGVIRSRSAINPIQKLVDAARDRVGPRLPR